MAEATATDEDGSDGFAGAGVVSDAESEASSASYGLQIESYAPPPLPEKKLAIKLTLSNQII